MEIDLGRLPQLFTATLMTLAAVILLGPGAPAILVQHAADRAMARLGVRRSKWSPGPFRSLREPLLTLRQAQGEDTNKILMLSLSKHEVMDR